MLNHMNRIRPSINAVSHTPHTLLHISFLSPGLLVKHNKKYNIFKTNKDVYILFVMIITT